MKAFLTFLAVEKKVSASSQNQAFNALLFFFRHVLKKEFGQMDGVVRARHKPYIPVVLSREEIDAIFEKYVPETKEFRRYHLHETHVQKAIIKVVRAAHGKGVWGRTAPAAAPPALYSLFEKACMHAPDPHPNPWPC